VLTTGNAAPGIGGRIQLPFSHDQFLNVFAEYNHRFWPVAGILWILTLVTLLRLWRVGANASRLVATLLAIQWAWVAVAYHLAFFRRINPAATAFAVLFLLQAAIFLWVGVVRHRLTFVLSRSAWTVFAVTLAVYAMAYPWLGLLTRLSYPYMPTFGVPCPTAILTAGLLLLLPSHQARLVSAIPVIWAAIGGTAAFLLGIPADLALLVAGALVLLRGLWPGGHQSRQPP